MYFYLHPYTFSLYPLISLTCRGCRQNILLAPPYTPFTNSLTCSVAGCREMLFLRLFLWLLYFVKVDIYQFLSGLQDGMTAGRNAGWIAGWNDGRTGGLGNG